jgi:hypothetical protein
MPHLEASDIEQSTVRVRKILMLLKEMQSFAQSPRVGVQSVHFDNTVFLSPDCGISNDYNAAVNSPQIDVSVYGSPEIPSSFCSVETAYGSLSPSLSWIPESKPGSFHPVQGLSDPVLVTGTYPRDPSAMHLTSAHFPAISQPPHDHSLGADVFTDLMFSMSPQGDNMLDISFMATASYASEQSHTNLGKTGTGSPTLAPSFIMPETSEWAMDFREHIGGSHLEPTAGPANEATKSKY